MVLHEHGKMNGVWKSQPIIQTVAKILMSEVMGVTHTKEW